MLERQLSELTQLLLADDPKRGAQRALQVLAMRNNARVAALFTVASGDQQRLRLFASEALDQAALDVATQLFAAHRRALAAGEPARSGGAVPHELQAVMLPVRDEDDDMVGLVYLDSADPRFPEAIDLDGVRRFSGVLAAALAGNTERPAPVAPTNPESYLELTAPHEVRRHQLLLLLERHEWNVARVARAMGCARMTIYSWLARYGIERRRIRKTKPRIAPAD